MLKLFIVFILDITVNSVFAVNVIVYSCVAVILICHNFSLNQMQFTNEYSNAINTG